MGPRLPAGGRDGSGGPDGSRADGSREDRLEALIRAGLAGQADGPVDVAGLLDGARTGARRIRRRRQVAAVTALAVAVVGVPVTLAGTGLFGHEAVTWVAGSAGPTTDLLPIAADGGGDPLPAESRVLGGSAAVRPVPDGTTPAGSLVSSPAGAVLSRDATGRYVVGERALLQASDLGSVAPMTLADEGATAEGAGPTATPVCRTLPAASARAVAGRSAAYTGSVDDDWAVRLVVRVLPQSAASGEMDWLRRSMGYCASDLHLRRATVEGLPDDAVLGYQVGADPRYPQSVLVVGVVREGRAIASVELVVPGAAAADTPARERLGLDQTRRLLWLADRQLTSSELVRLAQGDPALAS